MTTLNRIVLKPTVWIIGFLALAFVGAASGQQTEDAERSLRCQNNLNLIASLEQQLAAIPPDAIWNDNKLNAAYDFLNRVQRSERSENFLTIDWELKPSGDEALDKDLSKTFQKCMEQETLLSVVNLGEAGKKCAEMLEAGLQRAIRDALQVRSKTAEIAGRMQDCNTNLIALGCNPVGETHNLTGEWRMKQGSYTGWLNLNQKGTKIAGFIGWEYHEGGGIQDGTFENGKIHFKIAYPMDRGTGLYDGIVSPSGKSMGGTASGELGGGSWTATRP